MTTRKFSAISLPHPKCSFEIGCIDLRKREEINLSTWLPRFSNLTQVIEVRKTGCLSSLTNGCFDSSKIINPYIVIDNARPELFLRRDFISKFVELGMVNLVQIDDLSNPCLKGAFADLNNLGQYELFSSDKNVLSIVLDERQYRRFGMIGKKVKSCDGSRAANKSCSKKRYRIDIDLKEEKLKTSNKYQDRLIMILRRLNPINKLYFRFVSGDDKLKLNFSEANDYSLEFFKYVIDEYALDGFKPVPLTGCSSVTQHVQRKWTNYSQLHPKFSDRLLDELARVGDEPSIRENNSSSGSGSCGSNIQRDVEILDGVLNIIDWLGYQLLSLDCDRDEIQSKCCTTTVGSTASSSDDDEKQQQQRQRLDVSCVEISGLLDVQQIQETLGKIFDSTPSSSSSSVSGRKARAAARELEKETASGKAHNDEHPQSSIVFRALNLYRRGHEREQDTGVILLQDCSHRERAHLIRVVGLSSSSSCWSAAGAW